ncbi:MAG: hypothetical protein QOG53_3443 [Frankiales bacterium]|nr:hypothetical protein [Frankiales bacterium]
MGSTLRDRPLSPRRTLLAVSVPAPTPTTRWRCTLCGNLTRFDVTRTTRATEFVHLDLAGEPNVEEREVLADSIEHVTCRWCNAVDQVELIDRPDVPAATGEGR